MNCNVIHFSATYVKQSADVTQSSTLHLFFYPQKLPSKSFSFSFSFVVVVMVVVVVAAGG
jgi:hypothetical protein